MAKGLRDIGTAASGTIGSVIRAVIVVVILGATAGLILGAIGDFNTALGDTSTNSTIVDTLMSSGVFQLMAAVAVVLGLVGFAIASVKFRGG